VNIIKDKILIVDILTYLGMRPPVEKDYDYVISLSEYGADVSFYEEMYVPRTRQHKYAVHTESFKFSIEIPMTSHMHTAFFTFFEEAYAKDPVDVRKAVRHAVSELQMYYAK
jgi:hypothetical protein